MQKNDFSNTKSPLRIHYFQHDSYEDLGYIGEWATSNGFPVSVTRLDIEPVFPDLNTIDWLIIMGGKMGTNEESIFPWLVEEKKYIIKAIDCNKIVLGICLGAQLIAASLDAKVFQNKEPEIGFFPVSFNNNAATDPVFQHFPSELTVLHLHNDTFHLPDGAIGMASSQITPNQAFRFRENVFAFQFHFEVTEKIVPELIKADNNQLSPGIWIQSASVIERLASNCRINNSIFCKVLDTIASEA